MIKLNKQQIKYLLENWFEREDLYNLFETTNVEWLSTQKFELDTRFSWAKLYVNNDMVTTINDEYEKDKWELLLKL